MTDTVDLLQKDIENLRQAAKHCKHLLETGKEDQAKQKLHEMWRTKYPHKIETERPDNQ